MIASISAACVLWAMPFFDRPLFGLARRATRTARTSSLSLVRGDYGAFPCNFTNDRIGGMAAAFLLMEGNLPELAEPVRRHADRFLWKSPRNADGLFCWPREPGRQIISIERSAVVPPFLRFAGRVRNRRDSIADAVQQISARVVALRDPVNGLLHQARGFPGPGRVTENHWRIGNGWALLALTGLCAHLPEEFLSRSQGIRRNRELMEAHLRVRDLPGHRHQDLPRHDSCVETSDSRRVDYPAQPPIRNDPHAFDPLILVSRQAGGMQPSGDATVRNALTPSADSRGNDLSVPTRMQKEEKGDHV